MRRCPSLRYTLIVYLLLVLSLGLLGNLVALLGSLFHDAIKTDKISVILLRDLVSTTAKLSLPHLRGVAKLFLQVLYFCFLTTTLSQAATDILISVFLYIPLLSTLVADKWVLGNAACAICHYLYEVLLLNKLIVLAVISLYRLWMLKKPPAVKNALSQRPWIILCMVIPVVAFLPFLIMEAWMSEAQTFFDPHRFICYGWNYYHTNALRSLLIISPVLVLPILVVLAANIKLIVILVVQARRTRRAFYQRRLFIGIKVRGVPSDFSCHFKKMYFLYFFIFLNLEYLN